MSGVKKVPVCEIFEMCKTVAPKSAGADLGILAGGHLATPSALPTLTRRGKPELHARGTLTGTLTTGVDP